MTIKVDSRHLPRSFNEWEQLVLACGVEDDTIETQWLERKGPLRLSTTEHKFTVAKAILAFANRDPEEAEPFLDGHALVLVGIEKTGEMPGVPRIEDHQLVNALKAYLGNGESAPRWVVHRHRIDDTHDVLVIDIDAPRPGDPIFTLQKSYDKFLAGTIFARQTSESAPADPATIAMLSRRLTPAIEQTLGVDLTINEDAISSYTYDPSFIEPLLEQAAQHYLSALNQPDADDEDPAVEQKKALWPTNTLKDQLAAMRLPVSNVEVHEEKRTEDQFRQQIADWAERVRRQIPEFARHVVAYQQPSAEFTIINTCGLFLEDVEVDLHIEGNVFHHPKPGDDDDTNQWLPKRPRRWGRWTTPRFGYNIPRMPAIGPLSGIGPNSTEFHNSGSVTARLTCQQLRPRRTLTFTEDDGEVITLLTTDLSATTARITYTVTARGLHDTHTGEIIQAIKPAGDVTPLLLAFAETYFKFTNETPS